MNKRAEDLKAGDLVTFKKSRVISVIDFSEHKVMLTLEYPDGSKLDVCLLKRTTIPTI